ncbi:MAG: hypothetical protein KBA26_05745 [Candidatus Delongbacteria bacterium]|nr:hypothetical protein [Candidatus Delongbacteria bacterium]
MNLTVTTNVISNETEHRMSLKSKVLIIISSTLILLFVSTYLIATLVLQKSFAILEEEELQNNIHRIESAFMDEIEKIKTINYDYSAWDDMVAFTKSPNPNFIHSNMSDEVINNLGLNYVSIINHQNQSLFSRFHIEEDQWLKDTAAVVEFVHQRFLQPERMDQVQAGLVLVFDTPILFVSHPILRTDAGGPSMGVYVTLKYLDQAMVDQIRQRTLLNFEVMNLSVTDSFDVFLKTDSAAYHKQADPQTMIAHFFMNDLDNQRHIHFRLSYPRRISNLGHSTIHYLMGFMVIVAVIITLLTIILFYKLVLSRLDDLNAKIRKLDSGSEVSMEILNKGKNEFARIIESFLHHTHQEQEESHSHQPADPSDFLFTESITAKLFIDQAGHIVRINPAGLRLFGVLSIDAFQSYSILDDPNFSTIFPNHILPEKEAFTQIAYDTRLSGFPGLDPTLTYNLICRYLPISEEITSFKAAAYIQMIAV